MKVTPAAGGIDVPTLDARRKEKGGLGAPRSAVGRHDRRRVVAVQDAVGDVAQVGGAPAVRFVRGVGRNERHWLPPRTSFPCERTKNY